MKPKRLLFALFVLYWIGVYGVTFFYGEQSKTFYKGLIPSGYKMYAPITNTLYDVRYEFYKEDLLVENILLSDYIKEEYDKGILNNKTSFSKSKLYEGSLKVFDFQYQTALYKKRYKNDSIELDSHLMSSSRMVEIDRNLKNFSQLYLQEEPNLKSDSVSISVYRKPMILPFQPDFKADFTYELGAGIFYKTHQIIQP